MNQRLTPVYPDDPNHKICPDCDSVLSIKDTDELVREEKRISQEAEAKATDMEIDRWKEEKHK